MFAFLRKPPTPADQTDKKRERHKAPDHNEMLFHHEERKKEELHKQLLFHRMYLGCC